MRKRSDGTSKLVDFIIKVIQDKRGENIIKFNLKKIENAVCDYFVICHGDSSRQVNAIASFIEEEVKKHTGVNAWHKEGYENAKWILLDYIDIVVHVFLKETRDYYNLEGLWADADPEYLSGQERLLKRTKLE